MDCSRQWHHLVAKMIKCNMIMEHLFTLNETKYYTFLLEVYNKSVLIFKVTITNNKQWNLKKQFFIVLQIVNILYIYQNEAVTVMKTTTKHSMYIPSQSCSCGVNLGEWSAGWQTYFHCSCAEDKKKLKVDCWGQEENFLIPELIKMG